MSVQTLFRLIVPKARMLSSVPFSKNGVSTICKQCAHNVKNHGKVRHRASQSRLAAKSWVSLPAAAKIRVSNNIMLCCAIGPTYTIIAYSFTTNTWTTFSWLCRCLLTEFYAIFINTKVVSFLFDSLEMMQRQKAPAHILIEIYLKIAQRSILLQK